MRLVLTALLSLTITSIADAQCSNGSCGLGYPGNQRFNGTPCAANYTPSWASPQSWQGGCSNGSCGAMMGGCASGQCGAMMGGCTNGQCGLSVDTQGIQYPSGSVVRAISGRYLRFDGASWAYCSPPATGEYANKACFCGADCPCPDGTCVNGVCPATTKAPAGKTLTEVAIPKGYALYQDEFQNLYVLKKDAVRASADLKPAGMFVWQDAK